jgi:hypothetical protein
MRQLAECQRAPGNDNTSSCCYFKPPSVLLHQEVLVLLRLRSGLGLGCVGGGASVCAARGCEIWLSADGLGVAVRVRVAAIAGARRRLRPGGV